MPGLLINIPTTVVVPVCGSRGDEPSWSLILLSQYRFLGDVLTGYQTLLFFFFWLLSFLFSLLLRLPPAIAVALVFTNTPLGLHWYY
ncbi:hypothetical protein B9Z19DRAFT_730327 [Tuber borchii]|uniref:Uncharacterized protein n=1 Tax=Tuber borchii TaxID=42251 RepID=A0A2T6ZY63_TUBBO|nr:hypothetical protein B9Z19DRAFT_730327 [Tuber borchii]